MLTGGDVEAYVLVYWGLLVDKIILYADTDRIRESLFREEGSITKIDNVQ